MKFLTTMIALGAAISGVQAGTKGFNVAANNEDGSCKTQAQWEQAFNRLRNLPQKYRSARLYASSDCNTLANAVPAAQRTGTKLLVGVWTEDDAHFGAEKAALRAAIQQHGKGWIHSISVGSEDLYRGDTSADVLAGKIYDVRGMVRAMGVKAQVGHVDTWNAWTNPGNNPVIKACDFIGMDAYPYFQNADISQAKKVFFQALTATRNAAHAVKPNVPVWVTETSHPWKGANMGASHPSVSNARKYFKAVGCALYRQGVPTWWYSYQDNMHTPAFGLFDNGGRAKYATTC